MLLLEVERKFRCLAVKNLLHYHGVPAFQSIEYRGKKTFHDIYYDDSSFLSSKGVWVRQRDGHWQAKIRRGGDFNNSKFEELSGRAEISRYLAQLTWYNTNIHGDTFGLSQMAAFTTLRERWLANKEFTIVQDVTDFGHTVGEVELECKVDYDGHDLERYRDMRMAQMDAKIDFFMQRYAWAFCPGVPMGKLTAYFEKFGRS
ncbi:hypothetical protein P170DRAFT_447599 [Aspergillus steynii IBT 23096]|uniref:Thiamine-triphosphatase n=1 Tax=Aspergillus steynii IBT 23096 TaxID=1392250 RepID=A0A2I2G474_9EURO|nr:uncharacterized protein P170DRAFT_447599 [Aspergillus steynii IBT 23096]PLB47671.1 hypothetical protein P170DRAFT_447599 [Aspergillus steynii IBT 23096]